MIERSEELSNWLRSNPSELPGDNTLFSTLLTFEAIYGTVWWVPMTLNPMMKGLMMLTAKDVCALCSL
jgi:hypothetical protein